MKREKKDGYGIGENPYVWTLVWVLACFAIPCCGTCSLAQVYLADVVNWLGASAVLRIRAQLEKGEDKVIS